MHRRCWRSSLLGLLVLLSSVLGIRANLKQQHFEYDEELARLSVIYSSAAYDRNPAVSNWTFVNPSCNERTEGFIVNETYNGDCTEAFAYVGVDNAAERIVVAFKGTSDLRDWMTDLRTWVRYSARCTPGPEGNTTASSVATSCSSESPPTIDERRQSEIRIGAEIAEDEGHLDESRMEHLEQQEELIGNVHFGFCEYYQSVAAKGLPERVALLARENPSFIVFFTGHSLGAAAAALGAADMTQRMRVESERVMLYTLGEPRAGDGIFAEGLNDYVGTSYRVVHNRDVVPHLALCCHGWFGKCREGVSSCPYQHSTEIVYANDMSNGSQWLMCNDTVGEDYACDPQAWDLSVSDHTHYFELLVGTHCSTAPGNEVPYSESEEREVARWKDYGDSMREASRGKFRIGAWLEKQRLKRWPLTGWQEFPWLW